MTAGPLTVEPPEHPLHALATYEVSLPARTRARPQSPTPARRCPRASPGETRKVLAEQESRVVIADTAAR